mmetsp:Transcript_8545/g.23126  ORF Transcript_8545/g.23126 Transcript_8545/m.23126 type:complete len:298 (-) Transcript_8545:77-970(-)
MMVGTSALNCGSQSVRIVAGDQPSALRSVSMRRRATFLSITSPCVIDRPNAPLFVPSTSGCTTDTARTFTMLSPAKKRNSASSVSTGSEPSPSPSRRIFTYVELPGVCDLSSTVPLNRTIDDCAARFTLGRSGRTPRSFGKGSLKTATVLFAMYPAASRFEMPVTGASYSPPSTTRQSLATASSMLDSNSQGATKCAGSSFIVETQDGLFMLQVLSVSFPDPPAYPSLSGPPAGGSSARLPPAAPSNSRGTLSTSERRAWCWRCWRCWPGSTAAQATRRVRAGLVWLLYDKAVIASI